MRSASILLAFLNFGERGKIAGKMPFGCAQDKPAIRTPSANASKGMAKLRQARLPGMACPYEENSTAGLRLTGH